MGKKIERNAFLLLMIRIFSIFKAMEDFGAYVNRNLYDIERDTTMLIT